jgi:hypothetical protein
MRRLGVACLGFFALAAALTALSGEVAAQVGQEVSVPRHMQDDEEFNVSLKRLLSHGQALFAANWTVQEGGGRPLTKGTGAGLSDPNSPLLFPHNFNRVSAPDANSCAGCHNTPFGIVGGGGDFVAGVFVLGQRFDFASFDPSDTTPTRGTVDELGNPALLQTIGNGRASLGMFGSGFIEMLAREITVDLQATRDAIPPGGSSALASKGISYGTLARNPDGTWDSSAVEGIPATSLAPPDSPTPPSLVIRPFHQAARVVSLREFSNNAFNHHHGIQSTERFGIGKDPDGDLFLDEMTRADVTAVSIFQATLAVPGQVIPSDPELAAAVKRGGQRFGQVGCTECHMPTLPLNNWIYTEPNPFNPPGNLQKGQVPDLSVDLTSDALPPPRLKPMGGVVQVPAFTDLKLHDITCGPGDPNIEPLDMQHPPGSPPFFAGNAKFITRKLWGIANEPPFYHHGQYTTMREAVLAHCGEALESRVAFEALPTSQQDAVIEFLKSLQVLPPGTHAMVVDELGRGR